MRSCRSCKRAGWCNASTHRERDARNYLVMRGYRPIIPLRHIAAKRDSTAFEDVAHDMMVADVAAQLGQSCRLANSAPSAMILIFAQAMSE